MYKNIERLFETGLFNIKPGLDRITRVLQILGSPHEKINYVIVGGTNGKGSVSTYLANILYSNNHKTGLYTSPHLVDVTERLKINGREITRYELENLLDRIFSTIDKNSITLSFFELITVCAFIWFYENRIDLGILEVGMGGRWDATNVVNPLIAVITNVSLEHTKYLGDTVEQIAGEKAELIKRNSQAVTACEGGALKVIESKSDIESADLYIKGRDFDIKTDDQNRLIYKGLNWNIPLENLNQSPRYQINNIAISMCCADILNNRFKYSINSEKLNTAIRETRFSGRFEIVRENPLLILDGSHNEDAAKNLADSLMKLYPDTKFNFLISMLNTKDIDGFLYHILRLASKIVITEIPDKLTFKAEEIEDRIKKNFSNYVVIKDPVKAFKELASYTSPSCVCGSLYLIGHLKKEVINEKTGISKT